MCGVVMRTIGPSRSQNSSSATIDAISAPQPHSRGFSSTVTSRPVFATSDRIVCVSSGTSERTSTTVHEMPCSFSRISAASSDSWHHRGERDDRAVLAVAQHVRLAELVDVLAVGHLALHRIERLLLEEEHRVGIAHRRPRAGPSRRRETPARRP